MGNPNLVNSQRWKWVRRMARIIGSLAAALWFLAGLAGAILASDLWTLESGILTALIVASLVSGLTAWWREAMGGAFVVVCGVAFSIFAGVTAGHNKVFAVMVTGVPFSIAGLLFLGSWRIATSSR
jgi:hypothetical protein